MFRFFSAQNIQFPYLIPARCDESQAAAVRRIARSAFTTQRRVFFLLSSQGLFLEMSGDEL